MKINMRFLNEKIALKSIGYVRSTTSIVARTVHILSLSLSLCTVRATIDVV